MKALIKANSIAVRFWGHLLASQTVASSSASASCYSRPENIAVMPVIVAELEFCDVQRHVLGADLVERADDAALEDRPEAFNRADNVLPLAVLHDLVRIFVLSDSQAREPPHCLCARRPQRWGSCL
jgi:hypothetical protein